MSLRIKTNLSPLISSIQQNGGVFSNPVGVILGKVYGVITTPDTPTKELYELNGGASNIGLIFYKQYTGQEVKDKDQLPHHSSLSFFHCSTNSKDLDFSAGCNAPLTSL